LVLISVSRPQGHSAAGNIVNKKFYWSQRSRAARIQYLATLLFIANHGCSRPRLQRVGIVALDKRFQSLVGHASRQRLKYSTTLSRDLEEIPQNEVNETYFPTEIPSFATRKDMYDLREFPPSCCIRLGGQEHFSLCVLCLLNYDATNKHVCSSESAETSSAF
jgi:hypothetical protein